MTELRLSLVIPAFNAGGVIGSSVGELRTKLTADIGDAFEIIVVDDGSTDATAIDAEAAGAHRGQQLGRNRGKGAAVRTGMALGAGASVVFTDADLAYSTDQVLRVLDALEAGADVAIGKRTLPDSARQTRPSASRRLSTLLFNAATRAVLSRTYADTQCGLKGFRAAAARQLAARMKVDGFAFDVEILHLAEKLGLKIVDVPVSVAASGSSSVRLALHAPQMLKDLVRIRLSDRRGVYDDATP